MRLGWTPPPPDYPEYQALLAAARTASRGFVNPAQVRRPEHIANRRGGDWATAVIGRPYLGLRHITSVEAALIVAADAADIDPPLPQWLIEERAATAEHRQLLAERRAAARHRDEQAWAGARGGCLVDLEVRPNLTARPRSGQMQNLGHAVPLALALSGTRRQHPPGRALCETAGRRPMRLGEPTGDPATCVRCLDWTTKIRPAAATEPGGRGVAAGLVDALRQARRELRDAEVAEHPNLTDALGRVWTWKSNDLYVHDSMAWTSASILHPNIGWPTQVALANPNYQWCATCRAGATSAHRDERTD